MQRVRPPLQAVRCKSGCRTVPLPISRRARQLVPPMGQIGQIVSAQDKLLSQPSCPASSAIPLTRISARRSLGTGRDVGSDRRLTTHTTPTGGLYPTFPPWFLGHVRRTDDQPWPTFPLTLSQWVMGVTPLPQSVYSTRRAVFFPQRQLRDPRHGRTSSLTTPSSTPLLLVIAKATAGPVQRWEWVGGGSFYGTKGSLSGKPDGI